MIVEVSDVLLTRKYSGFYYASECDEPVLSKAPSLQAAESFTLALLEALTFTAWGEFAPQPAQHLDTIPVRSSNAVSSGLLKATISIPSANGQSSLSTHSLASGIKDMAKI